MALVAVELICNDKINTKTMMALTTAEWISMHFSMPNRPPAIEQIRSYYEGATFWEGEKKKKKSRLAPGSLGASQSACGSRFPCSAAGKTFARARLSR